MTLQEKNEWLWLARCLYTETNRKSEMPYVAWVVRNRVERGYRRKKTYRDVVLDPWQFSAFNDPKMKAQMASYSESVGPAGAASYRCWQDALEVAREVIAAPPCERPFPADTLHYYSPVSMKPKGAVPAWARGEEGKIVLRIGERFVFYRGIK